ncbi:YceD family protein [Bauldia litoralis]|uniref:Uncharacterized metal-binding protein YceD, DUF177 family n=1 Tax=Bauldia litoralis TaxID=665467 RepID=A0A1G6DAH7_9HYPH|nr:DUF177 domain-containing protein [Bauldia litoralis]SDB42167.1 Uncharacterized metal-binding protein YceD, DUF177 family [Bauldia litoralis]
MSTNRLPARPIDVDAIPPTGHIVRIETGPDERAAIAKSYGLVAVNAFVADLEAQREANRNVAVEGRIRAEIVQECVVSLAPVTQAIDETFRVRFIPADERKPAPEPKPGAEVHVDPDDESPDVLPDRMLDLGAVALEHFALAIDPYPRAPGAELPAGADGIGEAKRESPFAVLAKIARNDN